MGKIDARKLSTIAQQKLRNKVIKLRKKRLTFKKISELTGLNRSTCNMWWRRYQIGGEKVLQIKKRGRPANSCRKLSKEQEAEIRKVLFDKCPDDLRLPFMLWTRVAVQQMIEQRLGVEVPIRTIGDYFKRWNFTFQKPLKHAYEQNPEVLKKWYYEEYFAIQQRARKEAIEINWGGRTSLCIDGSCGRSHTHQGETSAIGISNECKRMNTIFTVTNRGQVRFMVYHGQMNADTLINFIERLFDDVDQKIFLILDNLSIRLSDEAQNWIEQHFDQIEVFLMPPSSTEPPPNGYLDSDMQHWDDFNHNINKGMQK